MMIGDIFILLGVLIFGVLCGIFLCVVWATTRAPRDGGKDIDRTDIKAELLAGIRDRLAKDLDRVRIEAAARVQMARSRRPE